MNDTQVLDTYKSVLNGNLRCFPRNFWVGQEGFYRANICMKYLIEDILDYDVEQIKIKVTWSFFYKNKLGGMLRIVFDDSPYKAVNHLCPNKIFAWQMKWCPMSFYDDLENRKMVFKWVLEQEAITSDSVTALMFRKYNVAGLIDKYNGNLKELLSELT